jgi:hypothetical protein
MLGLVQLRVKLWMDQAADGGVGREGAAMAVERMMVTSARALKCMLKIGGWVGFLEGRRISIFGKLTDGCCVDERLSFLHERAWYTFIHCLGRTHDRYPPQL